MKTLPIKAKVLFKRFLRGFVAGFAGSAVTLGVFAGQSIQELKEWLVLLLIAGTAAGISGGLLSIDKYLRWTKEEPVEN
jgi:hypothetical protein